MNASTAISIYFDPILPQSWLIIIGLMSAALLIVTFIQKRKFPALRLACIAVFILALLQPSILKEERQSTSDIAVVVVDTSASQSFGSRAKRTQQALQHIEKQLAQYDDLELRIIEAPESGALSNDTQLFSALDKAYSDVPISRRAGVIFLSDGQIHDVPDNTDMFAQYGPMHLLLTGEKNEKDRQLVIETAPSYGIVGQSVSVEYKIEDTSNIEEKFATITVTRNAKDIETFNVTIGETLSFDLPIDHAGQNVFEITVNDIPGEITTLNNRTALIVNGVRDRLRVLLVSGRPHAGGRTWRNLLTSDPGVDLVHFTILRDPSKLDSTPQKELSLIAFPFRELFEIKLYDFDLIIFDRYQLNHILPSHYFKNIAKYVEEGGALLESSGPSFAGDNSIHSTALGEILPGIPDGQVLRQPFLPTISKDGKRHPVTRSLLWNTNEKGEQIWGKWLRQVSLTLRHGDVLMTGIDKKPLLILDRVGKGRVAQLASDHIWLWSRGYDNGGPHRELLRRIVHWLMKEPELDELALRVQVNGQQITVRSQNYNSQSPDVIITKPDGESETIKLEEDHEGFLTYSFRADQLGIYSFEDQNQQKRFAIIGETAPKEYKAIKTTPEPLKPLIESSNGGTLWLNKTPEPEIGHYTKRAKYAGRNWIGLKKNNDFIVTGVKDSPVLPSWVMALILLGLVTLMWWLEGRKS